MNRLPRFVDLVSPTASGLSKPQPSCNLDAGVAHLRTVSLAASERLLLASLIMALVIASAAAICLFDAATHLAEVARVLAPSTRDNETVPAPATGQHLDLAALRYCYDQQERLQIIKPEINGVNATNFYNALVVDYNSRCSDFFYKDGDLATVKAEIIAHHDRLADEAKRMMAAMSNVSLDIPTTSSHSTAPRPQ